MVLIRTQSPASSGMRALAMTLAHREPAILMAFMLGSAQVIRGGKKNGCREGNGKGGGGRLVSIQPYG